MKKTLLVRQRDATDCGPACIVSVCAYYGLQVPVSLARQYASTDKHGTSLLGLNEAANRFGLEAKAYHASFPDLLRQPFPAIVHVIINKKIKHYMVLVNAGMDQVTVMDPMEGRFINMTHEKFIEIWTGIVVVMSPGNTFRKGNKKSNIRRFGALVKPHKYILMKILVATVITSALGLSMSLYVQKIADRILPGGNMALLHSLSFLMVGIILVQFILSCGRSWLVLKCSQRLDSSLILGYYRHVLQLPCKFFDSMRVGEIISRVNDGIRISSFINEVLVGIMVNIMILFFSIILMFIYNQKLALVIILMLPLYSVLYMISDRLNKRWQRKIMESGAELDAQMVETITAAATIKRLALEEYAYARTSEKFFLLLKNVYDSSVRQIYVHGSFDFFTKLFTVLILWLGSYYVIYENMSVGELFSFYALLAYFTSPIIQLAGANKNIREAFTAADRLFEIMDLEKEKPGLFKPLSFEKEIRFADVSFGYGNGPKIIRHANFCIRNGNITGIAGNSGSGKSTLAALLQKIYLPCEGRIFIDGADLNYVDTIALRKLTAIVPQQTELFSGTVEENIAIGDDEPGINKIHELMGLLGIDPSDANLSGGQKQRISVARAMYREPAILILDEPTASADAAVEERIVQAVEWYRNKGNTVIIISHHPAALEICDEIIYIENGRIA